MLLLRIVGLLAVVTIGAGILAWLVTRERRYLVLAGRVATGALVFAVVVLVLMAAERLVIL